MILFAHVDDDQQATGIGGVWLLIYSEGVMGDDAGPAADAVEPAAHPASSAANSTSVPSSYQYDTSGMTELSLLTDEVLLSFKCSLSAFHCCSYCGDVSN